MSAHFDCIDLICFVLFVCGSNVRALNLTLILVFSKVFLLIRIMLIFVQIAARTISRANVQVQMPYWCGLLSLLLLLLLTVRVFVCCCAFVFLSMSLNFAPVAILTGVWTKWSVWYDYCSIALTSGIFNSIYFSTCVCVVFFSFLYIFQCMRTPKTICANLLIVVLHWQNLISHILKIAMCMRIYALCNAYD